jgi:hypothetical protein
MELIKSTFHGAYKQFVHIPSSDVTLSEALAEAKTKMEETLKQCLEESGNVKVNVFIESLYRCSGEDKVVNLKTQNLTIKNVSEISQFLKSVSEKLLKEQDELELKGSNWSFISVLNIEMRVKKFTLT